MNHEDCSDIDQKSNQQSKIIRPRQVCKLVIEDAGGNHDKGGEEDVVDGIDHGGVENIQGPVEIVHLDSQAKDQSDDKDVGEPILELVEAIGGVDNGQPKGLDTHDSERANEGADEQVDKYDRVAVPTKDDIDSSKVTSLCFTYRGEK